MFISADNTLILLLCQQAFNLTEEYGSVVLLVPDNVCKVHLYSVWWCILHSDVTVMKEYCQNHNYVKK